MLFGSYWETEFPVEVRCYVRKLAEKETETNKISKLSNYRLLLASDIRSSNFRDQLHARIDVLARPCEDAAQGRVGPGQRGRHRP